MSEPTRVMGVEGQEECNKSVGSAGAENMEEEPKEAAVNKREGRDNAANLKGMMQ